MLSGGEGDGRRLATVAWLWQRVGVAVVQDECLATGEVMTAIRRGGGPPDVVARTWWLLVIVGGLPFCRKRLAEKFSCDYDMFYRNRFQTCDLLNHIFDLLKNGHIFGNHLNLVIFKEKAQCNLNKSFMLA
ncbi:unnamed protein product, partial [Cuscuta epithymum]